MFNFLRNYQIIFQSGCDILQSHQQRMRVPVSLYCQCLLLSVIFIIAILGVKWYLTVVFNVRFPNGYLPVSLDIFSFFCTLLSHSVDIPIKYIFNPLSPLPSFPLLYSLFLIIKMTSKLLSLIRSVFHTAVKMSFLKCRCHHVTPLLKTFQKVSIALKIRSTIWSLLILQHLFLSLFPPPSRPPTNPHTLHTHTLRTSSPEIPLQLSEYIKDFLPSVSLNMLLPLSGMFIHLCWQTLIHSSKLSRTNYSLLESFSDSP